MRCSECQTSDLWDDIRDNEAYRQHRRGREAYGHKDYWGNILHFQMIFGSSLRK